MNFEDFIDNNFNGNDPADLKELIDFLENKENLEKLFQFWNSLESSKITGPDEIFQRIIKEIRETNEIFSLRNEYK